MLKKWYLWVFLFAGIAIVTTGALMIDRAHYSEEDVVKFVQSQLKYDITFCVGEYVGDGVWEGTAKYNYSTTVTSDGLSSVLKGTARYNTVTKTDILNWRFDEELKTASVIK